MDADTKANLKLVAAARKADRRLRFCALYEASRGFTVKVSPPEFMRVFAEMKSRLALGCWKNISHLQADVAARHGIHPDRMG
jgi:hypothetical protein